MKNFNTVRLKKNSVGRLSDLGAYGYWYPSFEHRTKLLNDCDAEHLALWKNQDPYYAFKIKASNLALGIDLEGHKEVCVWFTEKELIRNMIGEIT
tara:strand:+ start:65 stop:349 length:285 start_codon:yes stop_codon:yes gene_type:complete